MTETRLGRDGERQLGEVNDVRAVVRTVGAMQVLAGLLALVGPAVTGNDDDGLVNTDPGLFLGVVAVNRRHALLHAVFGAAGLGASRDAGLARRYLAAGTLLFGALAAVGWREFGFERGVHLIAGIAVDGWGNLGHSLLSAFGLATLVRTRSWSSGSRP